MLDFNKRRAAILYDMFIRFRTSYYETNLSTRETSSSVNAFLNGFILAIIDCSWQNESNQERYRGLYPADPGSRDAFRDVISCDAISCDITPPYNKIKNNTWKFHLYSVFLLSTVKNIIQYKNCSLLKYTSRSQNN